jgi:[ribosomal protein S5]-alanine N-acetyltransferase
MISGGGGVRYGLPVPSSSQQCGDGVGRPTLTMRSWGVTDTMVGLRPFQEGDLELLARFSAEPAFSLPFEWAGYRSLEALRRRWEEDGFLGKDPHQLVIADAEGAAVGWVMWRDPSTFGRQGWAWEIGIMLAPESRGQGAGTAAQRLLVEYLFETTLVHRLCAFTEVDNAAERRALEKCGFRREGVLRRAAFRGGEWRDVVVYALLRDDVGADQGI